MRWSHWLILALQALVVGLFIAAVRSAVIPLGIPGEWEWLRVRAASPLAGLAVAAAAVAVFVAVAAWGDHELSRKTVTRTREGLWLAALAIAAVVVQFFIPWGAPDEYDLTKWAYVNYLAPSTGYYQVAREQAMADPARFLADYPLWIRDQDSLHIGTHPPGLIAVQCLLLKTMERNGAMVDLLTRWMPYPVAAGFRQLELSQQRLIPRSDRAALFLTALLTLAACAGTVLPLYLLARSTLPPRAAWGAASLWPLAPAANLFQPGADTAYPFLSTLAVALAAWGSAWNAGSLGNTSASESTTVGGPSLSPGVTTSPGNLKRGATSSVALLLSVAAGGVLATGMFFTLAFLPVGLIVALVILSTAGLSLRSRGLRLVAVGVGFLATVGLGWWLCEANPWVIWSWNLHHHARFYDEYPRSYFAWLAANPLELAVAIGLPSAVWCLAGLAIAGRGARFAWVTLGVLAILNLTGRNLGEVARLWLLFCPPLLTAAGAALDRAGRWPTPLAMTLATLGFQTLALETMIQVVYPV